MTADTTIKRGSPPQKWPFFTKLKVGFFHEETDLEKHDALRTAASRAGRNLGRKFRVVKETVDEKTVIRVYRVE